MDYSSTVWRDVTSVYICMQCMHIRMNLGLKAKYVLAYIYFCMHAVTHCTPRGLRQGSRPWVGMLASPAITHSVFQWVKLTHVIGKRRMQGTAYTGSTTVYFTKTQHNCHAFLRAAEFIFLSIHTHKYINCLHVKDVGCSCCFVTSSKYCQTRDSRDLPAKRRWQP